MTEIKNCLPETAWTHFIDLRNIRLSAGTNKYQQRLQNLRAELAAKGQGRSGWQEMEEWKYKVELLDDVSRKAMLRMPLRRADSTTSNLRASFAIVS